MKELYRDADYPVAHVEASSRYFTEAFPDDVKANGSFGDRKITPDFDITFGITHSNNFQMAAIAIDVHVLNDEAGLLEFAQSLDDKDVLVTCLLNAIDPIRDYFEELQDGDDELPKHFGLMLLAEGRGFDSEDEELEFAEHIENICFPVPLDKDAPLTAYLFTTVGYKDTESEISVGSMVFATGSRFGDDSGFPPYWSYAETVSVFPDDIDS
jgi:hypothetical protein